MSKQRLTSTLVLLITLASLFPATSHADHDFEEPAVSRLTELAAWLSEIATQTSAAISRWMPSDGAALTGNG